MRTGPHDDFRHLRPIAHLFVRQLFDRCPCDDHPIKPLVAHRFEVTVEHHHVFDGRVLRRMAFQLHERDVELQRCIRQQPYEIRFGGDFQGHEVEYGDTQGTDVLRMSAQVIHHEDIFSFEYIYGRQLVGYSERHFLSF